MKHREPLNDSARGAFCRRSRRSCGATRVTVAIATAERRKAQDAASPAKRAPCRVIQRFHRLLALACVLAFGLGSTLAFAEIVVVVSKDNAVETISHAELADLYLGRRSQFPDGSPAVPIDQRESAAAYPRFYADYLDQTPAQVRSHWSRLIFTGRGQPPRSVPNGQAMADAVADDPRAVGYINADRVDSRLRVVRIE